MREYLAVLDDAALGGATLVTPKRIDLTDPASRWTAATREAASSSGARTSVYSNCRSIARRNLGAG